MGSQFQPETTDDSESASSSDDSEDEIVQLKKKTKKTPESIGKSKTVKIGNDPRISIMQQPYDDDEDEDEDDE